MMDTAVSQQEYAKAEQYRVRLKELAEEKALATEKEQASPRESTGKVRVYPFFFHLFATDPVVGVRQPVRTVFQTK